MDHGLLTVDAQPSTLEEPAGVPQQGLEEIAHEGGMLPSLTYFAVGAGGDVAHSAPALHPEALDPAIFAGLLAP